MEVRIGAWMCGSALTTSSVRRRAAPGIARLSQFRAGIDSMIRARMERPDQSDRLRRRSNVPSIDRKDDTGEDE